MSEFTRKPPEGALIVPGDFLEKRYHDLMVEMARTSKPPATPMRTIGKNRGEYTHRGTMQNVGDIKAFAQIETKAVSLANDYYAAAKQSFDLGSVENARQFIDTGMQLLSSLDIPVPESFTLLNMEILAKV